MSTIHLLILAIHLLATVAKLLRPGGVRAVVAESVLLKHQLVISSRARRRAPNLNSFDRFVLGLGSLFVPAGPVPKLAVMLKPQDLVEIPRGAQETQIPVAFLVGGSSAPRPKRAIAGTHRRDRRVQAPQSPDRLSPHRPGDRADLWRRYRQRHRPPRAREALSTRNRKRWPVLAELYRDLKDSLWSVDLFRCESILLRSHWVMVVMDVFTRRIIGFGVERADLCGALSTWGESWKSSGIITTSIAFTSRSPGALREKCLANRRRFGPSLPTTHGGTIAAVCSRCRSRRNLRIRHRHADACKPGNCSTDLPQRGEAANRLRR